jgi:hypothetical protein
MATSIPIFSIPSPNGNDDTAAIQAILDKADGSGGIVNFKNGTYRINALKSLFPRSKQTLALLSGTILQALPNKEQKYYILRIQSPGVTVQGGILKGVRDDLGQGGEWGMGIGVHAGAVGTVLQSTRIQDCWGDGIYVNGGNWITLDKVVADNNRRQGLSIVAGEQIKVMNSSFLNTNGTLPMYGVDIEPNDGTEIIGVQILNCRMAGNAGGGISQGVPHALTGKANVMGIFHQGNIVESNGFKSTDGKQPGINVGGDLIGLVIRDGIVKNNADAGIYCYGHSDGTFILNMQIDANGTNGIEFYQAGGKVSKCAITHHPQWAIRHDYAELPVLSDSNTMTGNKLNAF